MSDKQLPAWLSLLQRRILGAGSYSLQGLKACYQHEEAFRVEVVLATLLILPAWWLADTSVELVLLVGAVILVMIVELLNSAVEAVVDRFGGEHHELSGRAKDIGSAAVMMSMLLFLLTWVFIGIG